MVSETLYATTDDGWALAMHHWKGVGKKRHFPILMVHGLGGNRLHFDLDERYSLARAASARGFDVYVVELRGAGLSRAPGGRNRSLFQWGFSDYSQIDVPKAIELVLQRSGKDAVHGLGHSMGGMLLYAQGSAEKRHLRSISAIGSPLMQHLDLGFREKRLLQLAMGLAPGVSRNGVPLRRLVGTASRLFIPLTAKLTDGIFLNASNVDASIMARMSKEAIDDIPLQLLLELTQSLPMTAQRNLGPFVHETLLEKIDVPVMVLSGSMDRIAPPNAVASALSLLRAPDVRYREFGTKHGDRADYGHVDLLVGRHSPDEVYPLVLDFIEEVD